MDIRIVKNSHHADFKWISGPLLLQVTEGNCTAGDMRAKKYELLNADTNVKEEIAPEISKFDIWEITDLSSRESYIYFSNCYMKDKGRITIRLYRYLMKEKTYELLLTEENDSFLYPKQKRTKVFVLDENYILLQHMYLKSNERETYQGFMDFELILYSIKEQKTFMVTDPYLVQAGIEAMIPVSKNVCAIKTGYQLLENQGFDELNEKETVFENIGFVNVKQMISDILVKQKNIYIDIIDQVKWEKTIPACQVAGDYVIYSRVSRAGEEEVIFYHYGSKEISACIFPNANSMKELSRPCIMNGMPYLLMEGKKGSELYQVKKGSVVLTFGKEIRIMAVAGGLLVCQAEHTGHLFKKPWNEVQIYQAQDKKMIVNEKGSFLKAVAPDENTLYLFIR